LRTAVTEGVNDLETDTISVMLVDMKTSAVSERRLTRTKNLWLTNYTEGVEGIAVHLKWERGADGLDHLIYPAEESAKGRAKQDADQSKRRP
jgi:hypothetical protein